MSLVTRKLLASAAVMMLGMSVDPAVAANASLKSMSLQISNPGGVLRVISTDKQKWDKIAAGGLQFTADMKVDTRSRGYVETVAVVLGDCGGDSCEAFPGLWSKTVLSRDYVGRETIGFLTSRIPTGSGSGIPVMNDGQEIIDRCNQNLSSDGPTKSYSFTHTFSATLLAGTDKATFEGNFVTESNGPWPAVPHEIDYWRTDTFDIQVVCDPVIKPSVDQLATDFGEFDVENVKLFLTTYQSNQPGSNPGTVCPALKVTSRAQANQAGAVSMRIWRQKDDGPITSEFKQVWASYDAAKNGYFATYEKFEEVGTTSYFQFKAEIVETGPFGPTDGWKDITVHCTNPGGGGFTVAPEPSDDGPKANWNGSIIVADQKQASRSCPRKGNVTFAVTRAEPGDFDYRISCSNGAFFTGTASGNDQGGGVYLAYGAYELSINRTRSIQCTLQELRPAPVTIATGKHDFACNNPAIDPSADDIVSDPKPNPSNPKPATFGDLVQPCGDKLVRINGKCVQKPGVTIRCLDGYEQVGRKCVKRPVIVDACKKTEQRIDGKCVTKPEVSIFCKKGFRPAGKTCVRIPTIATACLKGQQRINGKCVKKPEVSILCKKGFRPAGKTCVRIPTVTKTCGLNEKLVRGTCVEKPTIGKIKPKLGKTQPKKLKPFVEKKQRVQPGKALKRPAKRVRN